MPGELSSEGSRAPRIAPIMPRIAGGESLPLSVVAPGGGENNYPHTRLDCREGRAVRSTKRVAEVINAGRVQVWRAVAVNVHSQFDHPHELHQVHGGLPDTVARSNRSCC